jgi:hypothetical protein
MPEILEPFLEWLTAEHGWTVDLHDRRRIGRVLRCDHPWTVEQLGYALGSILAHNPDQIAEFDRHYRSYFTSEDTSSWRPRPLDRSALIRDLQLTGELKEARPEPDEGIKAIAGTAMWKFEARGVLTTKDERAPTHVRFREVPWPAGVPVTAAEDTRRPRQGRVHLEWNADGPCQFFLAEVGDPPSGILDEGAPTSGRPTAADIPPRGSRGGLGTPSRAARDDL